MGMADAVGLGSLMALLLVRSVGQTVLMCAVFNAAMSLSATAASSNATKYAIEGDRCFSTAAINSAQTLLQQCLGRVLGPILSMAFYSALGYEAYVAMQIGMLLLGMLLSHAFIKGQ